VEPYASVVDGAHLAGIARRWPDARPRFSACTFRMNDDRIREAILECIRRCHGNAPERIDSLITEYLKSLPEDEWTADERDSIENAARHSVTFGFFKPRPNAN
jgi:hypothetical protein